VNFWRRFCSDGCGLPQKEETNPERRCGGGTQNKSPQVQGWAHATPTPERMPARGRARRDWRELANARTGAAGRPGAAGPVFPGTGERAAGGSARRREWPRGANWRVRDEPPRDDHRGRDRPAKQLRASGRRDTCHSEPCEPAGGVTGAGFASRRSDCWLKTPHPAPPKSPFPLREL
jgi:hypothetical protein